MDVEEFQDLSTFLADFCFVRKIKIHSIKALLLRISLWMKPSHQVCLSVCLSLLYARCMPVVQLKEMKAADVNQAASAVSDRPARGPSGPCSAADPCCCYTRLCLLSGITPCTNWNAGNSFRRSFKSKFHTEQPVLQRADVRLTIIPGDQTCLHLV